MPLSALTLPQLLTHLEKAFTRLPARRIRPNTQYDLSDAGLGAFAVFFTQSPSFLAHQRAMQVKTRQSNAVSVFGLRHVPSDNQLRNLLDPVPPSALDGVFREVFQALEQTAVIPAYRSFGKQLLIALDGTHYFASEKISCAQCNHRVLANGHTQYFHTVVTPVLVQPDNPCVFALEPAFVEPQDGHAKQDCELQAAKRWLAAHGAFYAQRGATLLADDLFCHQPFWQAAQALGFHLILTCKPDSHAHLYTTVAFLTAQNVVSQKVRRHWNGRFAERHTYRYINQLALTADPHAVSVNWCELTITRDDTHAVLYHNAFATDFPLSDTSVEAIVRDGRARWKVENENNNVLKTKGYHLEHNFGHGQHHLAALLLTLNLLAFLFHTVLEVVNRTYHAIRQKLGARRTFFQDLDTLLRYVHFANWEALLAFMFQQLDLDPG